ncbi:MAG: hypothetical protein ACD_75C01842G0002, partial [uncultured bacterium]
MVFQADLHLADGEDGRVVEEFLVVGPALEDILILHPEKGLIPKGLIPFTAEKTIEGFLVVDIGGNPLGIKLVEDLILRDYRAFPQFFLGFPPACDERQIVAEKGVGAVHFARHQGRLNKEIAGFGDIFATSSAKIDFTPRFNDQSEQGHRFIGHNLSGFLLPMGIRPGIFAEMAANPLKPLLFNRGNGQGVEPGRLDKRCGNQPLAAFHRLMGAGKDHQLPVMGALVDFPLLFRGDVAQKPGQQRGMDLLVGCVRLILGKTFTVAENSVELIMQIDPFAHPLERQKIALTIFFKPRPRDDLFPDIVKTIPDIQQDHEIGVGMGENLVGFVGFLFVVDGPDPGVLDGQHRRDDFHFPKTVVFFGLDDDPRNTGIDGQIGHDPAPSGKMHGVVDRTQFPEKLISFLDRVFKGRIDKGKFFRPAEVEGNHLENDLGQIGTLQLRQGVGGPIV